MRRVFSVLSVIGFMLFGSLVPVLWSQGTEGSLVIVLQDGRRQTFQLAEVSRIEFHQPDSAVAAGTPMSRSRFVGRWRVGMGGDDTSTFEITLKQNGKALKSVGDGGGTWTVVNGEARISWDDGWHDVIRKVGGRFRKDAYSPGRSLSEEPTNTAPAEYLEAQ